MSRPSWIAYGTVAFVLLGCAVFALSQGLSMAVQPGAPARLVQTTHGTTNLLTAARLENDSKKPITSYKIGWAYVRRDETEFHTGALMNVPAGIKPGVVYDVPDQAVLYDPRVQGVIFFVAELTFADGSRWHAANEDIRHEADLQFRR
jgi:hypothetical protein